MPYVGGVYVSPDLVPGQNAFSFVQQSQTEPGNPTPSLFDIPREDYVTAFNSVLLKDGSNQPTDNLDFNDKRVQNLGDPERLKDAANFQKVLELSFINITNVSQSNAIITLTYTPDIPLAKGQIFKFFASALNKTNAKIIMNTSSQIPLHKENNKVVVEGDLQPNQPVFIIYTGTSFLLLNQPTKPYFADVTFASPTLAWNVGTHPTGVVTLTNNAALTISNDEPGKVYSLLIKQDSTGGRTLTLPTAWKRRRDFIDTGVEAETLMTIRKIGTDIFVAPFLKSFVSSA